MGSVGAAGHGWGQRTTTASRRRGRRRRAGRKSRQGRDAVVWLGAAPRGCSRETVGHRDGGTAAVVDPVWRLS